MRLYIDASAATKLIREESETPALKDSLDALSEQDEVISSLLLETELRRIAVRESFPQMDITRLLSGITLVHPERDFFHSAGLLPGRSLRALDAVHLITAIKADAQVFIAYDRRLAEAAAATGFTVDSPS
jgi:uncharacterized protein